MTFDVGDRVKMGEVMLGVWGERWRGRLGTIHGVCPVSPIWPRRVGLVFDGSKRVYSVHPDGLVRADLTPAAPAESA